MKRAFAAAVAAGVFAGAGIAACWRNILRHLDRNADGPDTWDDEHRHLNDDQSDDA